MGHVLSPVSALIIAGMVGAGAHLHKIDTAAKETLAEAARINLESQKRLQRIQADERTFAAERRKAEALDQQRLQQIAERESQLRDQAIATLESQARQAEQLRLAQQQVHDERQRLNQSLVQAATAHKQYEERLSRIAAIERQQEARRRQEDQIKAAQLAATEERARVSAQAAAAAHLKLHTTPAIVVWQRPAPATIVHHSGHYHAIPVRSSAVPPRPCPLPSGFRPAATKHGGCS